MEARLSQLRPLIEELFELSGSPGLSLGVLHHGVPTHTAHFGRRRASQEMSPDNDTLYNLASMTKLITAGVVSNLVVVGLVDWDVPVRHYLPEFGERRDNVGQHATLADLLANRTGLSAQNTFWGVMMEDILPDHEQIPRLACHIPTIGDFRKTFVYSTWGYAIVTSVIERVTGQPFSACVDKYIYHPLGMKRSTTNLPAVENISFKHWVNIDGSAHEFPWSEYRGWCDETGFGGAIGARSSTKELLMMYQSLLHAYNHQKDHGVNVTPGSPFKYATRLLSPHVGIGNAPPEKQGYCLGTYSTQLPGNLSSPSINSILMKIKKKAGRSFGVANGGRLIFHQVANFTGYSGSMFLDPQSQSAIFVLVNSLPLFDVADTIGQILLGSIFDEQDPPNYVDLAKSIKTTNINLYDMYANALGAMRTKKKPSLLLEEFEGEYCNDSKIMCYTVSVHADTQLRVSAKGSKFTHYLLDPWGGDVFCLCPNRALELAQSRWPFTLPKSRIFTFECREGRVLGFTWHHDNTPGSKPEIFSRATETLQSRL